jgi:MYXO-CTERM domain-containing protein
MTLPVTVSNVLPDLAPLPYDQVALKGVLYRLSLHVSDPGSADTLSFSLVNAPVGMAIRKTGARTGQLEWTPTTDQCSTGDGTLYMVKVQVLDSDGGYDSETLEIRAVRGGNGKPVIPGILSPIMGEIIDALFPLLTVSNVPHDLQGVAEHPGEKTSALFTDPLPQPLPAGGCSMSPEGSAPVQGLLLLTLIGVLRRRASC